MSFSAGRCWLMFAVFKWWRRYMGLMDLETVSDAETVNRKQKLLLIAIGMLLTFPVISICVDLVNHNLVFSGENVQYVFTSSPLHGLIFCISIFSAVLFYYTTKKILLSRVYLLKNSEKSKVQWNLLQSIISGLENGDADILQVDQFENQEVINQLSTYKKKIIHEKRQEEIRLWQSDGMTRFSEILRSTHDVSKLSDDVIKFVVNYTGSNQGSLYVISDIDEKSPVLELKAVYAYSRKKYITQTIEPGEGLIGQCYLEKETIRLLQVPADYIKITSGLGEATPRSVVLVPLKSEDVVYGVLELASFTEHSTGTIAFLEMLTTALASTVQTLAVNNHVRRLLESSQQQTEELRAQEEEMRQNMEELQAIQEQLSRQLAENTKMQNQLEARENVLGLTTILSEADLFGTITFVNAKFCQVSQYTSKELIGKPHNVLRHPDMPAEVFKLMWSTIKKGEVFSGIVKNRKKDGTHYWVDATIVPIIENGKIVKYIGARYHIENESMAEELFRDQLERLGLTQRSKVGVLELEEIFQ